MVRGLLRAGIVPLEMAFAKIAEANDLFDPRRNRPKHPTTTFEIEGQTYPIKTDSLRYAVFRQSLRCVTCGVEGKFFVLERNASEPSTMWHLNLYAVRQGQEVLMTKDHIFPKSLGGTDSLTNLQTMCDPCNCMKAATPMNAPKGDKIAAYIVKRLKRSETQLRPSAWVQTLVLVAERIDVYDPNVRGMLTASLFSFARRYRKDEASKEFIWSALRRAASMTLPVRADRFLPFLEDDNRADIQQAALQGIFNIFSGRVVRSEVTPALRDRVGELFDSLLASFRTEPDEQRTAMSRALLSNACATALVLDCPGMQERQREISRLSYSTWLLCSRKLQDAGENRARLEAIKRWGPRGAVQDRGAMHPPGSRYAIGTIDPETKLFLAWGEGSNWSESFADATKRANFKHSFDKV